MGSSSNNRAQNTDPRITQAYLNNLQTAQGLAAGLPERQFADFTPAFQQGAGVLTGQAGMAQQTLNPAIASATQGAMGMQPSQVMGGSFLDANLGAYQNPFQQQVIDQTMADLDRSRQMVQQQTGDAAARAGAFGGSRQGVLEAETNRAFFDRMGAAAGGLRAQGFDTAAGLAGQDLQRNLQAQLANQQAGLQGGAQQLQAAGLLGSLAGQQQQLGMTDASALMNLGLTQQQFGQQQLDAPLQRMLQQQELRNQALGIIPGGTGGVGQRQSPLGQIAGAGGAILGGMATGGTGFFSDTGIFSSDRRLKENIVQVGVSNGLPLYEFSYIGQPKRYRGVMADEVERLYPEAIHVSDTGYKMVDYNAIGVEMQEVA